MISCERVREVFTYSPDTGRLCWRENKGTTGRKGELAGFVGATGYQRVKVDGAMYMAHRLIWLYVYGVMPSNHIDHIDGNPANNRIENLRDATNTENMENQRRHLKNNKTGFLGVSFVEARRKYRAQIWVGPRRIHIGYYDTAEDAHAAYVIEKRKVHAGCTI